MQRKLMKEDEDKLISIRHSMGIYSIKELCTMFDCNRSKIDAALNSGLLTYMSPNNRARYIHIDRFVEYMQSANISTSCTEE